MPVLNRELAELEVQKWMDTRVTRQQLRDLNEEPIKALVDAFMDGLLSLDEDNYICQKLQFPIGDLKTIKYKPRLSEFEKTKHTSKTTPDYPSQVIAILSALSGENSSLLKKLDTDDIFIARSLTSFFF